MYDTMIEQKLNEFYEKNQIPNILLYGGPNRGKQTLLNNFLNKVYQNVKDKKEYILRVDCIYGKGIQFIRDEIKFFAKTNINLKDENGQHLFKSVILLNAEKLTIDAQSALRRCIELFSGTTRFFMVVNERNNVLAPILSRFSEIYVPLVNKKGTHSICNHKNIEFYKRNRGIISRFFKSKMNGDDIDTNIVKESEIFYRKGVNAIDIMLYIETLPDSKAKFETLVYIDDIRYYIRNEVLLITLLLYKFKNAFSI